MVYTQMTDVLILLQLCWNEKVYAAHGYMKPHMHNKEMAFDYMEVSTSIF